MTYAYRCRSCGCDFEITATVAEYRSSGAPACPRCGRAEARRVFTPIMVTTGASAGSSRSEGSPGGDWAAASNACGCGGTCSCRH